MKPIPDNVADILNQLSGPHQVALRSYIATLRAEIRQFEEDLHAQEDADPHAHYHGAWFHDEKTEFRLRSSFALAMSILTNHNYSSIDPL